MFSDAFNWDDSQPFWVNLARLVILLAVILVFLAIASWLRRPPTSSG